MCAIVDNNVVNEVFGGDPPEAGEEVSDQELHDLWHDARDEIDAVRLYGDLALAAFFAEAKPKQREAKRLEFAGAVTRNEAIRYLSWLEEQRDADPPLAPFHCEVEFPEVFDRENQGFDAFVGNPPFAGKNAVAAGNVGGYPDWLKTRHEQSHGNADLVAHFFRRAFDLVRAGGTFGLIATNTIAQGDTRSSGLRWICEHGGEIYRAVKRYQWPGEAAVVVSVLHVAKTGEVRDERTGSRNVEAADSEDRHATGRFPGRRVLDGTKVDAITAFLFHRGDHANPVRSRANAGKSFVGSYVLGMGFTFDDTDKKGVASSLAEMRRLIEADPRNSDAIFPYIGGEEVNTSPTHAHHRYVINFRDYPLRREALGETWQEADAEQRREWLREAIVPLDYPGPVAMDWPDLTAIVEQRVRPERMKLGDNGDARRRKEKWWLWGRYTPALFAAIDSLDHVLAISSVGQQAAFAQLPSAMVYSHALIAFPLPTYAAFCTLQSRPHEIWARFLGSSMKDDLRYTPSDCFETFPFPDGWEAHPALETTGMEYYEHRAALMIRNDEGMTKTCNRFHDPYENDPDISQFRKLHAAMDRAVLDAYGWTDIPTDCDFLLDYEIDEATWGRKKKPYRYRWPDPVRDEVLARLLALNAERAAEEVRAGASATDAVQAEPVAARPTAVRDDPAVTTQQRFSWTMRDGC